MAEPETSMPGAAADLPASELALRRAREGDRLQDEQRYDTAIAAYEQALALDVFCQPAWYSLGCAWLARGEEARAVSCLEQSTALNPGHGPSHHNLGKARFKLGLIDEALGDLERALGSGEDFLPRTVLATITPACQRRICGTGSLRNTTIPLTQRPLLGIRSHLNITRSSVQASLTYVVPV